MTPDPAAGPLQRGGSLFLVLGPSGVGKSTAIRCIRERIPALGYPLYTRAPFVPVRWTGWTTTSLRKSSFYGFETRGNSSNGTSRTGRTTCAPVLTALARGKVLIREVAIHGLEAASFRARRCVL